MFKAELIDNQFKEVAKRIEEISQKEVIFETEGDATYQDLVDLLDTEGRAEFNCGTCRKFVNRVANLVYFEGTVAKALFWRSLDIKDEDLRAKIRLIALRVERSAVKSVFWNKGGKVEEHPITKREHFVYHLGSTKRKPFEHFHASIWIAPLTCLREYPIMDMEFKRLTSLMPLNEQIVLLDKCCKVAKELMPFTQNIIHHLSWTRALLREIWLLDGQMCRNSTAKLLAQIPHNPTLQTMVDKFYSIHKEALIDMLEEAQVDVLSAIVNYLMVTDPANANVLKAESEEMSNRIHQVNHLRESGVHEVLTFHNASLKELTDDPQCIWKRTIEGMDPEKYVDLGFRGLAPKDLLSLAAHALSFQIQLPVHVSGIRRVIASNSQTVDTAFTWQSESKIALIDAKCDWVDNSETYADIHAIVDDGMGELWLVVMVDEMPDSCDLGEMMSTLKPEYDHYRLGVEALLHITKPEGRILIAVPYSLVAANHEFVYYTHD